MSKEKNILAIKVVRQAQLKHMEEAAFCRKHNMRLQEILHVDIERELGQIAMKIEDILETGYVSA